MGMIENRTVMGNDLFGNVSKKEVIRTLGFYQPFGSLMLHGKIETRWVRVGKKPPFPLGKYLFYTTKEECNGLRLMEWCGSDIIDQVRIVLRGEETISLNGYAIAMGVLKDISPMRKEQESECFAKYKGVQIKKDSKGHFHPYHQQCLYFLNVERIEPYIFTEGKQGVGILKH